MMIGSGCSCGIGGVVVVLEDFEQDIVDYLHAEAERLDRDDVLTLLGEQAREGDQWSISKLLDSLAQSKGPSFNNPSAGTFLSNGLGELCSPSRSSTDQGRQSSLARRVCKFGRPRPA